MSVVGDGTTVSGPLSVTGLVPLKSYLSDRSSNVSFSPKSFRHRSEPPDGATTGHSHVTYVCHKVHRSRKGVRVPLTQGGVVGDV